MPKVSVIIPNYNHARFLPKRIESVLRQTYQDFELILLDDCSKDDSKTILSSYAGDARTRVAFNDVNSGSTFKQWNKGVRMANGEYVWLAESDDYADERLLETLVARLDREPRAVLAYCRSHVVTAEGELQGYLDAGLEDMVPTRWSTDFSADGLEECRRYMVRRNTVQNASSVIFRKDAYWQVGGADERLVYCGDWIVWAGMALTGGRIEHAAEALNYYRLHETTVTAQSPRMGVANAEWLATVRWIMDRARPDEATLVALRKELIERWVSAVLNRRVPIRRRWNILRDAMAIDPNALARLGPSFVSAIRLTTARRLRAYRESRAQKVGA